MMGLEGALLVLLILSVVLNVGLSLHCKDWRDSYEQLKRINKDNELHYEERIADRDNRIEIAVMMLEGEPLC